MKVRYMWDWAHAVALVVVEEVVLAVLDFEALS